MQGETPPPNGAAPAEATVRGSQPRPMGEAGSPPTVPPTFGDHRRQPDRQQELHGNPNPTTTPSGENMRSDYRQMSSQETIVAMLQETLIKAAAAASAELHRGDPKAVAAATYGALSQFFGADGFLSGGTASTPGQHTLGTPGNYYSESKFT